MHSVSDLTTFCRKTTGDVPPKLVGASTTVVGSKMYLFGGRLVTERRMVADLFVFDLETLHWEKITSAQDEDTPGPRYFHSADAWNQYLIIFGGMGVRPDAESAEDLCVLNDVRLYDLSTRRWMPSTWSHKAPEGANTSIPKARYAHLSSVSGDRLFVIGGQDLTNVWLDDVYVYDLNLREWVQKRSYPRHCGTYRSVAVSATHRVRLPQEELKNSSAAGPSKPTFRTDTNRPPPSPTAYTSPESFTHLPYSAQATDEFPNDVFLYSNYNFTDVKRELEVFTPLPDNDFSIADKSSAMTGSSFPPGLRFPTGAILGTHLIIAGTYLAHTYQSFSVWALDLITMVWTRVDPGSTLATGSWFRSCLWAEANKFLIFGNRHGNLVDDYNRRLLSWDHVAVIDLEAFGIYQPPRLELDIRMQEMGLVALEEGVLADFEIVCDDDRRVKCSRKVLEDRWPWFKEQRQIFLQAATKALDTLPMSSHNIPKPEIPPAADQEPRPDPRLTPRTLLLSEPYPITLALVQYFYSLSLLTPLQHAPAVLSALLVLATNYNIPHLQTLVKHAMHRALSNATSVGVYEVATLCSCRSLQIRALKTVMVYNQRRPSARSRQDNNGGGSSRPSEGTGNGGGGGGPSDVPSTARPRGMSDAWMQQPSGSRTVGLAQKGQTAHYDEMSLPQSLAPPVSAVPLWLKRGHQNRTMSIVSLGTDSELAEMGDLLAPALEELELGADMAEHREQDFVPPDEQVDPIIDSFVPSPPQQSRRGRGHLHLDTHTMPLPPRLSPSPLMLSSSSSESDHFDDQSGRNFLSPSSFYSPYNSRPHRPYRDSDTPSLLSSTSRSSLTSSTTRSTNTSYLSSPPHSPSFAMSHVIDFHSANPHVVSPQMTGPNLAVIDELDNDYYNNRRTSTSSVESKHQLQFAHPDLDRELDSPVYYVEPTIPHSSAWIHTHTPNIENLRIQSRSPVETITAPSSQRSYMPTPEPQLSSPTTKSGNSSPSISRFFGGRSGSGSDKPSTKASSRASVSSKDSKEEEKMRKAEEKMRKAEAKKRKEAESRARLERLAEELKAKSEKKKSDSVSVYTNKSDEKKRKASAWEEESGMYSGLIS